MANNAKKSRRPAVEEPSLITRVQYRNTLPELPFPPKFLGYPFDPNRSVQYAVTTLERNHKHKLLVAPDVCCKVNLIDEAALIQNPEDALHPDDEELLQDAMDESETDKRHRNLEASISWLRRTEYISMESKSLGKGVSVENKILGGRIRPEDRAARAYKGRDAQIEAITRTFLGAKKQPTHPTKSYLKAVEIIPIYPDNEMWCYEFIQSTFDTDPTPQQVSDGDEMRQHLSEALLVKQHDSEENKHFASYFLPTENTIEKRKRRRKDPDESNSEEGDEYTKVREYAYDLKTTRATEDNYFFMFKPEEKECVYNHLTKKLRLTRRRTEVKTGPAARQQSLFVTPREFTEEELKNQDVRLAQLKAELPGGNTPTNEAAVDDNDNDELASQQDTPADNLDSDEGDGPGTPGAASD